MSRWSKFRSTVKAGAGAGRYEDLGARADESLRFHVGEEPVKRVLLFTKPYVLQSWREEGELADGVAVMVRYGLPTKGCLDRIQAALRRWHATAAFIGDLDPLDLTVFAAYRCLDAELRAPNKWRLPIEYRGIDDRWLRLCERHLLPGQNMNRLLIKMSAIELEHFQLVDELIDDLDELVGPRCAAILRSGRKLELEGATNPAMYGERFPAALRRLVLRP